MTGNQLWAKRVLVCSLCQFLRCQYSRLSQFQATYTMSTNSQIPENLTVTSCKSTQACMGTLLHLSFMYMHHRFFFLISHGTVCLGTILFLLTGSRVSDIFFYLPLHPSFSFSTFSMSSNSSILLSSSTGSHLVDDFKPRGTEMTHPITPCHSLWHLGRTENSKLGITDFTVATGTVQL